MGIYRTYPTSQYQAQKESDTLSIYLHSVGTKVTQAEYARTIRDDNHVYLIVWPVVYHGAHIAAVLRRKVHASRSSVDTVRFLAG